MDVVRVGMVDVVCVGLGGCGENAPQWMWCALDVVKMHLSGCGACWYGGCGVCWTWWMW